MAKDRFSRQKPINWNSGWKQTGSFIKPEVKVVQKEYNYKTRKQQEVIVHVKQEYWKFMNEWERTFIVGIEKMPYKLTSKQISILKNTIKKYDYLL